MMILIIMWEKLINNDIGNNVETTRTTTILITLNVQSIKIKKFILSLLFISLGTIWFLDLDLKFAMRCSSHTLKTTGISVCEIGRGIFMLRTKFVLNDVFLLWMIYNLIRAISKIVAILGFETIYYCSFYSIFVKVSFCQWPNFLGRHLSGEKCQGSNSEADVLDLSFFSLHGYKLF